MCEPKLEERRRAQEPNNNFIHMMTLTLWHLVVPILEKYSPIKITI
jgi:hypothetical protein